MQKDKVDLFLALNGNCFQPFNLMMVKEKLEKLEDDKFYLIQSMQFQKPDTIFLIAILFGVERFFLDDATKGVLKLITCYGCFVWWLLDIFSAKERACQYNFDLFNRTLSFI
jgi:hypothetical protein